MKSNNNFSVEFVNANEVSAVMAISNTFAKGVNSQITLFKSLDDDMNKGTKNNRNPFLGRASKREVFGGWVLGTNYDASCERASERSGGSGEFVGGQSWHTYYNEFFETDKRTHSKYYLQMQRSEKQGSRIEVTYYLDGKEISKDSAEFAQLAEWFKKKSHTQSSTQIASGISADNERHYKVVALANIEQITQGAKVLKLHHLAEVAEVATSESK